MGAEGAMIFIFLLLPEIHLYYFWNWCVFYKKKRSKVNRIPNGTFGSNVLFWSKDLQIQHEINKLTLFYLNDSLCV